jgi:hypothetical protein
MEENTVYNKRNATKIYGENIVYNKRSVTEIYGGKDSIQQAERYWDIWR